MRVSYRRAPPLGGCGCSGSKLSSCGCGCDGKAVKGLGSGCGCGVAGVGCGCDGGMSAYTCGGGQMSGRSPRRFALAAFGISGAGALSVLGDVGFKEQWSYDDWNGSGRAWYMMLQHWYNLTYKPVDSEVYAEAKARWAALGESASNGSAQAADILGNFTSRLNKLADEIDQLTVRHFGYDPFINTVKRSDDDNKARFAKLEKMNDLVKEVSRVSVPAPPPPADPPPSSGGGSGSSGTKPGGSKLPPSSGGENKSTAPTKKDGGIPWGVVGPLGGATVLALLLILLPKKRSAPAPAVAGYRRRRRR